MLHKNRHWAISEIKSAEQLAENLTEHTWTLCTGFELGKYLFLNDSISENSAQEYAIVKKPTDSNEEHLQIESITFSWCDYAKALLVIQDTLAGKYDKAAGFGKFFAHIESSEEHGSCRLCR